MDLNAGHVWKSLITRYGSLLEPESLDTEIFELAVVERRALKVTTQRDGFGSGYLYFCRAQIDDAIKRGIDKWQNYSFCIVFPHPCELTDEEVELLGHSYGPWERWEEVCEFTDEILREGRSTEPSNTLETLFIRMTLEQRLCFKQAIVQQTIHYVTQHLPAEDKDDGERTFIAHAQYWIAEPIDENAQQASVAAVLDSIDGGVRNFDYSPYFLTPAEAAGANDAIHATSYALRAAGDRVEIAHQWQIAAAKAILQGQALPELDDG